MCALIIFFSFYSFQQSVVGYLYNEDNRVSERLLQDVKNCEGQFYSRGSYSSAAKQRVCPKLTAVEIKSQADEFVAKKKLSNKLDIFYSMDVIIATILFIVLFRLISSFKNLSWGMMGLNSTLFVPPLPHTSPA